MSDMFKLMMVVKCAMTLRVKILHEASVLGNFMFLLCLNIIKRLLEGFNKIFDGS